MEANFEDLFGILHPDHTECPDCGSRAIVPIRYGFLAPALAREGKNEEFIAGGCIFRDPMWHCKECFNDWPEDPPPEGLVGTPEWQSRRLREATAEYLFLTASATLPPQASEPAVERYWLRPDGRLQFLLRFAWGKVRIEKLSHLLPIGGPPVYEFGGGRLPEELDYHTIRRQCACAAIRFERRPCS